MIRNDTPTATVSVGATIDTATEQGSDGEFTITLEGDTTTAAVTVPITLAITGDDAAHTDYALTATSPASLTGSDGSRNITIPTGAASAILTLSAGNDADTTIMGITASGATPAGPDLSDNNEFGHSVAWLGDFDGTGGDAGVLAVGAVLGLASASMRSGTGKFIRGVAGLSVTDVVDRRRPPAVPRAGDSGKRQAGRLAGARGLCPHQVPESLPQNFGGEFLDQVRIGLTGYERSCRMALKRSRLLCKNILYCYEIGRLA